MIIFLLFVAAAVCFAVEAYQRRNLPALGLTLLAIALALGTGVLQT